MANWLLCNRTPCASHAEIINHYTLDPNLSIEKYFCLAVLCLVAACAILGNFYILICIVSYSALQRPGHLFLGGHSMNTWTQFYPILTTYPRRAPTSLEWTIVNILHTMYSRIQNRRRPYLHLLILDFFQALQSYYRPYV